MDFEQDVEYLNKENYIVRGKVSGFIKEKVYEEVEKFIKKHEGFIGEVIMQDDNCIIHAPELISNIVDNILKIEVKYE